jgi:hypothetical protein
MTFLVYFFSKKKEALSGTSPSVWCESPAVSAPRTCFFEASPKAICLDIKCYWFCHFNISKKPIQNTQQ